MEMGSPYVHIGIRSIPMFRSFFFFFTKGRVKMFIAKAELTAADAKDRSNKRKVGISQT